MRHPHQPKFQQHQGKRTTRQLFLVFLAIFTIWMALSPYGLWQYYKVSREFKNLRQENQRLETENRELLIQITRLQNDPVYIEEIARRDFGLLKKNELLFDFRPRSR
ncbi:MAG: septum formation initiator family protein [Desulfobulbaceae bacterium]|nr:MAG: septum formation initiator family protein [Desulfobulbaceae bacterium]